MSSYDRGKTVYISRVGINILVSKFRMPNTKTLKKCKLIEVLAGVIRLAMWDKQVMRENQALRAPNKKAVFLYEDIPIDIVTNLLIKEYFYDKDACIRLDIKIQKISFTTKGQIS